MKNLLIVAFTLLLIVSAGICKQPQLKSATLEPTKASPGDSLTLTVEFSGKKADVKSVTVLVREYPEEGPRITLKACEKSKKNVWSYTGRIPYDAPSEIFHLDISAIDKDGKEIVTKGCENHYTGRTGTVKLEVTW